MKQGDKLWITNLSAAVMVRTESHLRLIHFQKYRALGRAQTPSHALELTLQEFPRAFRSQNGILGKINFNEDITLRRRNMGKDANQNLSDCKPNYGNVVMGAATGAAGGARGGPAWAAAGAVWGGSVALANEARSTANCLDKKVQGQNQAQRNAARSGVKR